MRIATLTQGKGYLDGGGGRLILEGARVQAASNEVVDREGLPLRHDGRLLHGLY